MLNQQNYFAACSWQSITWIALPKRLPELLTDEDLITFYEAVWHARQTTHMVMIKLLLFTSVRNAELANVRLRDVDLTTCRLRIEQGKGKKDRYVLFPKSFRGELTQSLEAQKASCATYLFESNRCRQYSTRRVRQIIKEYPVVAGIENGVYPHLFRHQVITYLTKKGIISPTLQLLSGHAEEGVSLCTVTWRYLMSLENMKKLCELCLSVNPCLVRSYRSFPPVVSIYAYARQVACEIVPCGTCDGERLRVRRTCGAAEMIPLDVAYPSFGNDEPGRLHGTSGLLDKVPWIGARLPCPDECSPQFPGYG